MTYCRLVCKMLLPPVYGSLILDMTYCRLVCKMLLPPVYSPNPCYDLLSPSMLGVTTSCVWLTYP